MRKKIFFLLTILLLVPAPRALAENPERIAALSVSVWPEYDDPGVLVIYDGEFADKTGFPREVTFLVPASARVSATAYADSKGNFLNTDPWKTQDAGNGLTRVTFNLPTPNFHVEYYYSPLQGNPDKTMEFVFNAAHTIDKIELQVQEPLKATNFKTSPAAAVQTTRGHDFKYHILQFPALAVGQTLKVQVSYTKTDPNPSTANITIPTQPAAPESAASSNLILPIGLAATGLALGTLGFFAWRARRDQAEDDEMPDRQPRRKRKPRAGAVAYCHECGNALKSEDVFCSKCGTRRK